MKKELIKFAAKLFIKRKVNKMEKTLGEVIQLTKLNELMKKNEKNEKTSQAKGLGCFFGIFPREKRISGNE